MPKLTVEERIKAMQELRNRLIDAIDAAPRGLTDKQVWDCIRLATDVAGLDKEE